MPDVKFMINKRLKISLGAWSFPTLTPFGNTAAPTVAELNAMNEITSAVRVNGYTFNVVPSKVSDDRSFADEAASQVRGFDEFGGDMPIYLPTDYTNLADPLVKAFNLLKSPGVGYYIVTRVGPLATQAWAAGDVINVYKVMTDGYQNHTDGLLGGVSVVAFLPQGEVYPDAIVQAATASPITLVGTQATTLARGLATYFQASYQGRQITNQATWTSSNPAVLYSDGHGIFVTGPAVTGATGTATITCSFPGGTSAVSTAITIT